MISYEFEGFDLTEWAESGGLPVWIERPHDGVRTKGLLTYTHPNRDWAIVEIDGHPPTPRFLSRTEPRYSTLEDVIGDRPEWARHLAVMKVGSIKGLMFFFENEPELIDPKLDHDDEGFFTDGRFAEVKGHLFDPSVYTEPVKLEKVEK